MSRSLLLVTVLVGTLSCCARTEAPSGAPPTTLVPSITPTLPSPSACSQPALSPAFDKLIRQEIAQPAFQNAVGLKAPAMGKVRLVRELIPLTSEGRGVTVVVFDLSSHGTIVTVGLPITVTATKSHIDDWQGLIPPQEVGTVAVPVRVARSLFSDYYSFTYGTTSATAVTSVRETFVSKSGRTEQFTSQVCDSAFVLGGTLNLPAEPLKQISLELRSAGNTTLLQVDLDPGPIE